MCTSKSDLADLSSTGPIARAVLVALSAIVPVLIGHNIYTHVRVNNLEDSTVAHAPAQPTACKCGCTKCACPTSPHE